MRPSAQSGSRVNTIMYQISPGILSMACPMCILFKISPLEITLLLTISGALVVVGSVRGL